MSTSDKPFADGCHLSTRNVDNGHTSLEQLWVTNTLPVPTMLRTDYLVNLHYHSHDAIWCNTTCGSVKFKCTKRPQISGARLV